MAPAAEAPYKQEITGLQTELSTVEAKLKSIAEKAGTDPGSTTKAIVEAANGLMSSGFTERRVTTKASSQKAVAASEVTTGTDIAGVATESVRIDIATRQEEVRNLQSRADNLRKEIRELNQTQEKKLGQLREEELALERKRSESSAIKIILDEAANINGDEHVAIINTIRAGYNVNSFNSAYGSPDGGTYKFTSENDPFPPDLGNQVREIRRQVVEQKFRGDLAGARSSDIYAAHKDFSNDYLSKIDNRDVQPLEKVIWDAADVAIVGEVGQILNEVPALSTDRYTLATNVYKDIPGAFNPANESKYKRLVDDRMDADIKRAAELIKLELGNPRRGINNKEEGADKIVDWHFGQIIGSSDSARLRLEQLIFNDYQNAKDVDRVQEVAGNITSGSNSIIKNASEYLIKNNAPKYREIQMYSIMVENSRSQLANLEKWLGRGAGVRLLMLLRKIPIIGVLMARLNAGSAYSEIRKATDLMDLTDYRQGILTKIQKLEQVGPEKYASTVYESAMLYLMLQTGVDRPTAEKASRGELGQLQYARI